MKLVYKNRMKGHFVAKKKTSAKQTPKKSAKKSVSKAASKNKTLAKKAPSKAIVKKTASKKKVAVKKTAPVKKATIKKTTVSKKVTKPVSKKAVVKKTAAKSKGTTAAPQHLVKELVQVKKIDLSHFVTPLDDRLIVQLSGAEKMTAGGLYIPDTVSDTSGNLQGSVVAVGRGHFTKKGHLRPMDVKVGDKVVFPEYAGSKITIQNEDLVILRESDVMGVVAN